MALFGLMDLLLRMVELALRELQTAFTLLLAKGSQASAIGHAE